MNQNSYICKYISSLIHDCGKPATFAFKNNKGEPSDIAHYYGHENAGAYNSLFFNYANYKNINPLDVSIMINLHMLPHKWKKETPDKQSKLEEKYKKIWGEELFKNIILLNEADNYSKVVDKNYFELLDNEEQELNL